MEDRLWLHENIHLVVQNIESLWILQGDLRCQTTQEKIIKMISSSVQLAAIHWCFELH